MSLPDPLRYRENFGGHHPGSQNARRPEDRKKHPAEHGRTPKRPTAGLDCMPGAGPGADWRGLIERSCETGESRLRRKRKNRFFKDGMTTPLSPRQRNDLWLLRWLFPPLNSKSRRDPLGLRLTPTWRSAIRFMTKSQRRMEIGTRTIQNCGRLVLTSRNLRSTRTCPSIASTSQASRQFSPTNRRSIRRMTNPR